MTDEQRQKIWRLFVEVLDDLEHHQFTKYNMTVLRAGENAEYILRSELNINFERRERMLEILDEIQGEHYDRARV